MVVNFSFINAKTDDHYFQHQLISDTMSKTNVQNTSCNIAIQDQYPDMEYFANSKQTCVIEVREKKTLVSFIFLKNGLAIFVLFRNHIPHKFKRKFSAFGSKDQTFPLVRTEFSTGLRLKIPV